MENANLGFGNNAQWVMGPNKQWQRSDAYNPDTGEFYFPDMNGGQRISSQWSKPAVSSDNSGFVVGGMTGANSMQEYTQNQANQRAQQIASQPSQGGQFGQSGDMGLYGGFDKLTLNPYQPQMFDAVSQQVTQNLNRNVLPGLRSAGVSTGGYGGSRQGVVEANALNDANQGLTNALSTIQYGDFNNQQNRMLQNKGMDQSFYTSQRGQDLQQTGLGASIYNMGTQGMLGQGQGIYNLGLTAQQAPWQSLSGFANASSPYTGYGTATQNTSGNAAAGFLGGALGGAQAYELWRK